MTEENAEVDNTITTVDDIPLIKDKKTKNPKRVEQGRKLAEWNKINKKKLSTKTSDSSSTPSPIINEKPAQEKEKPLLENYWVLGGVIVVIGVVMYFINDEVHVPVSKSQPIPQVSKEPTQPPPPPKEDDPFDMA